MKLYSKDKNKKSAPALNINKSKSKIKTFKQLLNEQIHKNNNSNMNDGPKTARNAFQSQCLDTSIHSARNIKTQRYLENSLLEEHVQSSINYGSILSNNINLQNCQLFVRQNPCLTKAAPKSNFNKQNEYSHLNISQNAFLTYKADQNLPLKDFGKKINHYKNTRILQERKIDLKCFNIGKKIGKGRFGAVYIAQEKTTGFIVALKMIDLQMLKQEQMQSQIMQEIRLGLYMRHPNVIQMYGIFRQQQQLCLIIQYANEKCLFSKLGQKLEEKQAAYYTRQVVQALKYCHSESILHRDLKPQNILISCGVAKLADFGWAAYAPKYKRQTFCGTLDYVSPQILQGEKYDEKVDIWSMGILIYEMNTGRAPFESPSINPDHTEAETMRKILACNISIPGYWSSELADLVRNILNINPAHRFSLGEIESSSWMRRNLDYGIEVDSKIWNYWLNN